MTVLYKRNETFYHTTVVSAVLNMYANTPAQVVVECSLLCSDTYRDYEADYRATLRAEEVEHKAEGGRKRSEVEEDEEGRDKTVRFLACVLFESVLHPDFKA